MAVKPIIIPLIADTSGLQVGVESLEALGKVDKDVADQFRAANKAFQDRGKVLDQSVTSTDKFAAASKKLVESITGGAIAQATKNIEKLANQAENASADFVLLNKTIAEAKKQLESLDKGSPAFNKLSAEIEAAETAIGNFDKQATSSRAQLRQYREALTQLEEAGLENTSVFRDMAVAAGQLQDQVGDTQARIKALASDTFALDVGIQAVRGLAGAFSVAQGAAALFGDENEDVQKALLKVNAAVAILNGLQEIQNILEKQSAVSIAATIALDKIKVLQTNLAAAAESRFIVVRYAATAAQTALNAVMAANPAGILLTAIAALAGIMLYLTSNTDEAADAQEKLKHQMDLATESARNQAEIVDLLAGGYQNEIDLLRARGATRSQIAAAEAEVIKKQLSDQRELQKSLISNAGQDEEYAKSVAKSSQLRGQLRVKEVEIEKALLDESKEASKKAAEENKKNLDAFLRDQVAANEAALIESRDGFEKLFAQIQLINAKLRQELANPNLGPNERLAAELKAGEDIRKARQDLLGDLQTIVTTGQTQINAKTLEGEVLTSAQIAQARLAKEQEAAQERILLTEQEEKEKKEIRQRAIEASFELASSLFQSITEISRNNTDAQIQSLQEQLDKGLITQQQFDQKTRAIRRKAAEEEKRLALFQATINAAAAIVKVFASTGPPLSFILAATTAAASIAQIIAIQSKPIPAFAKGTKHKPTSGPALIGEAGPELFHANGQWGYADKPTVLNLPKGAKVIPTLETGKILERYNIPMPNVQQNVSTTYGGVKIDYNKMAALIGREIGKIPLQNNVWDGNGFSQYQTSLSQRKSYLNKRYSSK